MSETYNRTNPPKSLKAQVGAAHHALRAHVKALQMRSTNDAKFTYQVAPDGSSARIIDSTAQELVTKPIQDWARQGTNVRLALIGLKGLQELLVSIESGTKEKAAIRFCLDLIDQKATLSADGAALTLQELRARLQSRVFGNELAAVLPQLNDGDALSIAGWAKIGRAFEIDFFQSLQAAEQYGLVEAVQSERERGFRLSIIRRPRTAEVTEK